MSAYRSPTSGRPLEPDTPHSLGDGAGERWPVVDAIPYLRTGRAALVAQALAQLDAGERTPALITLLADQDDWWPGPAADPARLAILARDADALTFREAVDHLGFGRVGDYFAHRWSDPTYLAGLALMEAHWGGPATAFELACGVGHYGRDLIRRGVAWSGADVVFAKLWLARHWVAGAAAELVCFDAASLWPLADGAFDLVLCHDALYFLEPKATVVAGLRGLLAPGGTLAVAHVHNRDYPNHSAGAAVSSADLACLFPQAIAYDDAELTLALSEARAPHPLTWANLAGVEAFSLIEERAGRAARAVVAGLAAPPRGSALVRNPLYGEDGRLSWPSERYRDEYAARATYPSHSAAPAEAPCVPAFAAMIRSRELLDLPERW